MLHIIFFILKTAGIILAVILGIILLVTGLFLFAPVKYEIAGKCEGDPDTRKLKVKATWILHLFRFDLYYKKNAFQWRFRAAWKKMARRQVQAESAAPKKTEVRQVEDSSKTTEPVVESKKKIPEESEKSSEEPQKSGGVRPEKKEKAKKTEETVGFFEKIRERIRRFWRRLREKFQSVCRNLKSLIRKKEKLQAFLKDEVHRTAWKKTKKEVFRFLKKLKPKTIQAEICFGFDDPCTTGQVLAALSILYPIVAGQLCVTPDFEKKILKGTLFVKGKVRMCTVVFFLLRLAGNSKVRRTYNDIKSFEW